MGRTFVGFGFGAIQTGLFLYEAQRSGNFDRLVVVEVLPDVVDAVRNQGAFSLNIATAFGVAQETVDGVEIFDPGNPEDHSLLLSAISEASAIATALPRVDFYEKGCPSIADLLGKGLKLRLERSESETCAIYTAENHNRAAERLAAAVHQRMDDDASAHVTATCCFLNTVIA